MKASRARIVPFLSLNHHLDGKEPCRMVRDCARLRYRETAFRDLHSGKRAVILANFSQSDLKVSRIGFKGDKKSGSFRLYQPFQKPKDQKNTDTITIPAERLAIVVEKSPNPRNKS